MATKTQRRKKAKCHGCAFHKHLFMLRTFRTVREQCKRRINDLARSIASHRSRITVNQSAELTLAPALSSLLDRSQLNYVGRTRREFSCVAVPASTALEEWLCHVRAKILASNEFVIQFSNRNGKAGTYLSAPLSRTRPHDQYITGCRNPARRRHRERERGS